MRTAAANEGMPKHSRCEETENTEIGEEPNFLAKKSTVAERTRQSQGVATSNALNLLAGQIDNLGDHTAAEEVCLNQEENIEKNMGNRVEKQKVAGKKTSLEPTCQ